MAYRELTYFVQSNHLKLQGWLKNCQRQQTVKF